MTEKDDYTWISQGLSRGLFKPKIAAFMKSHYTSV